MEILLTVAAVSGFLAVGFLIGDMSWRRQERVERRLFADRWTETLAKVQAAHNSQVSQAEGMFDRLAAIDMAMRGMKK